MVSYVDQDVTFTASYTLWQWQFPANWAKKSVWVGVLNESQGPLTLQAYTTKGSGEPPGQIDPGQPFVSQMGFYLLQITGVSGQSFNVKIQDEPLLVGKVQQVSQSQAQSLVIQTAASSGTITVYTCPSGYKARVIRGNANGGGTMEVQINVPSEGYQSMGEIVDSGETTFGPEPYNDEQINPPIELFPGDRIRAFLTEAISIWIEVVQEPL